MATVKEYKEKLHYPIYDACSVKEGETFEDAIGGPGARSIRFFVDVQGKTSLETNLEASGVLPSQNDFEARAMRVVVATRSERPTDPAGPDAADILSELIYSSVTSLTVGEKTMAKAPTWFFPSGAGVSSGNGNVIAHGQPDPMATFRFAEAVTIEPFQSFRAELSFPQGLSRVVAKAHGPMRVWLLLDGLLTRAVQ